MSYFSRTLLALLCQGILFASWGHCQTTRWVDVLNGSDQGNTCSDSLAPCRTITHTIDVSAGGDVVEIAAGLYTESFEIDKPLVLNGSGETTTIIQAHAQAGQASDRVIFIDVPFGVEIELANLTIRHGNISFSSGGGILSFGANLTLTNVTISDNHTGLAGGGLRMSSTNATLNNVTFSGNHAEDWGGGLDENNSNLTLTNVSFNGNSATNRGGGLRFSHSSNSTTLNNVVFSNNQAGEIGGGMYLNNSSPTLTNVSFSDNQAGESGGGIYNADSSSPTLSDVMFSSNQASGSESDQGGGGIYIDSGTPALANVAFEGNSGHRGGGIHISGTNPDLRNLQLTGNVANLGGGIYVWDAAPVLTNALVRGNWGNFGGGMYLLDSAVTVTNFTLSANMTTHTGAGVYVGSGANATFRNSILWENSGSEGGNEMYIHSLASANLIHCLYGNEVDDIVAAGDFSADANSLTSDPFFLAPESGNFRLSDSSPAIDAGDPATDLTLFHGGSEDPVDLDNLQRVHGPDIDMGAYEWRQPTDIIFSDRFAQ